MPRIRSLLKRLVFGRGAFLFVEVYQWATSFWPGRTYTWSTVGTLWPSLLGLFFVGISGIGGDAGFNGVWMKAVGNYTVLLVLFGMILFGAVDSVGDTLYITKWILTRKIFAGRPLVFMALFYLCCSILAGLISPITGLIILWPISLRIAETMNLTRDDAA